MQNVEVKGCQSHLIFSEAVFIHLAVGKVSLSPEIFYEMLMIVQDCSP